VAWEQVRGDAPDGANAAHVREMARFGAEPPTNVISSVASDPAGRRSCGDQNESAMAGRCGVWRAGASSHVTRALPLR
jgi:hypothetical protein